MSRYVSPDICLAGYIGAMHHRLRVVTDSELRVQRRCAREHYYAYVLGIRPLAPSHALAFGTALHKALEAWWRASRAPLDERLSAALAALPTEMEAPDLARARAMMIGYHERWSANALVVLAVELEFHAPLIDPETGKAHPHIGLSGKIDALALDHTDDGLYIVEHKTSGEDLAPGSLYWQMQRLSSQLSLYYAGVRALGYAPAGVVYDVLQKPKQRPLQATPPEARKYKRDGRLIASQRTEDESPGAFEARMLEAIADEPDRFYARGAVVRLEADEREAQFDVWQQVQLMETAERVGFWPRNPDSCRRYHSICPYFDACTTGLDALQDPLRFRTSVTPHEELSTGAERLASHG